MDTYIVKRDGKHEVFTVSKIKAAIAKSFLASGAFATEEIMTGILSHLHIYSGIGVEEIQNQVEVALMR
jgi:ribonucleoside-triphosphate reductase